MVTDELINYIRGQISQGQSSESIKTTLLSQKWSDTDINEAFSQLGINQSPKLPQNRIQTTSSTVTETTKEKLGTKSLIVILLLVFLYPVGLIGMYLFTKWKWWAKLLITLPLILIIIFSILSVNPQEAIDKAEKLRTKCTDLCSNQTNYEACYEQCLSNRKQIE